MPRATHRKQIQKRTTAPGGQSTTALDNPVDIGGDKLRPENYPPPQRGAIDIGEALVSHPPAFETEVEGLSAMSPDEAKRQYLDELKFNENPVTVVIPRGGDRNAPGWVQCQVQGFGPEVWDERGKRWLNFNGWLPVNKVLTVKRKYLEVLARARRDEVRTREVTPTPLANQDGFVMEIESVQAAPFTIRHDPAGERGHEWYRRVMTDA